MNTNYKIITVVFVIFLLITTAYQIKIYSRDEKDILFWKDIKCREYGEKEYPGYIGQDIDYLYSEKINSCIGILTVSDSIFVIDIYKTLNLITFWNYEECKQFSEAELKLYQSGKCITRKQFEGKRRDLIGR